MRAKVFKTAIVTLGVFLIGAQVVPVDRTNPPAENNIEAPAEVRAVLERSCYDCHSNATKWPWYSYIAPVSWLIAHDVHEGREKLNYSLWNRLSSEKQSEMIWETWEEVAEEEMPPRIYLLGHSEVRITEGEREMLRQWAKANGREQHEHD